jgi:hypothetical protein
MPEESAASAWAVVHPYIRKIREFFGRNLVQHYLGLARQRAEWFLLIFLVWRIVPVLYETVVFPFDLDVFTLAAATTHASEERIRGGVVQQAEERGLLVDPSEIRVRIDPASRSVMLDVTYRAPINLFVKEFTLDFHAHSKRYAMPGAAEGAP